jgi:hypothetical protein
VEVRQRKEWAEIYQAIADQLPVVVENAIIEVPSVLLDGVVARAVTFKNCIVRGAFVATRVTFAETLSIIDTVFEGGLDLGGCRINGYLVVQNIECRSVANFEGLSVAGHALFDGCIFKTKPVFDMASFGQFTNLAASTFEDGASFVSAAFAGHLLLSTPKCAGDFDLTWATLGGTLSVSDAEFLADLKCESARIAGTVSISNTNFGPGAALSLERTVVGGDVIVNKCEFEKTSGNCLNLNSIAISGGCGLRRFTCSGNFTMLDARISRYLEIGTVDSKNVAATQRETIFLNNFSLSGLHLEGYLWCTATVFRRQKEGNPPDFAGVKIDGQTYIMACEFTDGANFNRAVFGGVYGTNATFERKVTFEGTRFLSAARFLPGSIFADGVEFYFAEFSQEANFGGAQISKRLSLRYAHFRHSLLFESKGDEIRVPDVVEFRDNIGARVEVALRGCTYAMIELPYEVAGLDDFLDRLTGNDLNSFIYLEGYLRQSGQLEEANRVRYHWSRLEGLRMLRFRPRWWLNRVHKYTTRYGTALSPLVTSALFIGVFGLVVDWIPQLHSEAKTIQMVSWTAASLTVALIGDVARRRVWPA